MDAGVVPVAAAETGGCVGAVWNAARAKKAGAPNATAGLAAAACEELEPLSNLYIGVGVACITGVGMAKNGCAELLARAATPNVGLLLFVTVPGGSSTGTVSAVASKLETNVEAGIKASALNEGWVELSPAAGPGERLVK